MDSSDLSVLVEELLDCDLAHLESAEVGKGSVEDVGEPFSMSPHLVPAEVGKGGLRDSLSVECKEVVLEKQSCSELEKESLHEQVAFVVSNSNADPAGATDIEVRSPKVRVDELEGEGGNVICLTLGEVSLVACGVGEVCFHDGHVENEGLHLENKSFFDVSEMPLNLLPFTDSLSNCDETTEQKDTKISDGGVAVRVLEVGEAKSEIVGSCCCQEVPAKNCDMPFEEDNDSNSIDDSSGKTLLEGVKEKCDVNTSSRVLPSPCRMSVEVLHTACSPGNLSQHVEQNDRNNVSASLAERVSEVVLEKSEVGCCTYNLLSQRNSVQQNEQKDGNSVNGGSAVRVMEMREDKDNVLNGAEMETYSNRSLVEENSCNFKRGSSTDPFNYALENSVTPDACPPVSIASNEPSKRSDVSDYSGTGAIIAGSNSSTTMDTFERMGNEGKDKVDFDSHLEAETPEYMCQSSGRSMHKSKSRRGTRTEKVAKKCRKTATKVLHSHKTIESLSKASRRKRSCFSKPARSSAWGILANISEIFVHNNQFNVHKVFKQGSQKARGRRRNKRYESQEGGSSPGLKGKCQAVTSRIRLKIKLGKQVDQSSIKGIASERENTYAPDHEVISDCKSDGPEDRLGEEMPLIRQFQCIKKHPEMDEQQPDASYLDAHHADKDLESTVTVYKSPRNDSEDVLGISTLLEVEVEASGEGIENKYLDPGTSPDSEVVNQIPDALVGLRVQEDLHDAPMTSSSDLVAPGNVKRLSLPQMGSMKGRKNGKMSGAINCIVNPLCGPVSMSENGPSENRGPKNALNNMSRGKERRRERFPLPNDVELSVSSEALTMGCGSEDNLSPIPDHGFGSFESENVEKFLPPSKTKGHKSSKSLKSSRVSKSKSEVPDIVGSRSGSFCGQKETCRKSVNKNKVKEKGVSEKVICIVDSHPEIGTHVVDAIGGTNMGSEDKSNLDMVPNGALEPYLPPRNAWVSCDECQKWRRIPATLADSIEDTNCKWTCKDNMDKTFADCSIPQEKSNAEINAELDISDASCEEDANGDRYNSKGLERRHSAESQQSSWTLIKSNLFLHRRRKSQTIDEIMVCHCKSPVHGRSGCGDECLNRMLNIECVKGTCPCGDRCSNQQFQKQNYAKLKCFRCGKKGYGLQLLEDISEGQFLIEYVGEVLDLHAYEARQMEYASRGHKHFYFMTLNGSEIIDACAKGNLGRFINHSCDPNCRTEKWMVNGEICIGLFAVRDIKKGEELTFDYNYVRVFGAAAKKCVCGSAQCRGYIGGDPLSTEVIVQGDSDDEYPEPVMVLENGEIFERLDNVIPKSSVYNDEEMQTEEVSKCRNSVEEPTGAVGVLEITTENEECTQISAPAVPQSQISSEIVSPIGKLPSSIQPVELPLQTEDLTSKPIPTAQQDITAKQEAVSKSLSPVPKLENLTSMPGKSISHTYDASKKPQSDKVEDTRVSSKSQPLMKTSYSSSSVKKGKHKSNLASANKSQLMPYKPKKVLQGSDNGRYEAVEEKLNELLDADGGISKRKDASKGYLKLLLLTAASGDSNNGEAIQSNRDLSMILDALLKTKSRMVLVDIINKNGLRMLHNIMKQSRKEYNKTPILRKLLKVIEYLAAKEILTLEHINGGPPCPGMESFRESMLTLTEHGNKQVYQIARNFRDRWIPRPLRKFGCMDDGRMEYYKGSNCNRFSASNNYWHDQGARVTEDIDCTKQSVVATISVAGTHEECSSPSGGHCSTNGTKIRKRKSRWDQPAETNTDLLSSQFKEQKLQPSSLHNHDSSSQVGIVELVQDHTNRVNRKDDYIMNHTRQDASDRADDVGRTMSEDVPPGFSYPLNTRLVSPSTIIELPRESIGHSKCPFEMVTGNPQERFIACLPVSYGIPLSILQQTGIPEAESVDSWTIAPGIAFRPFPPLPPYPRNRRNPSPCSVKSLTVNQARDVQQVSCGSSTYHMDQSSPSTSGAGPTDVNVAGTNNQYMLDRARVCSNDLGKRFRQQKWNNTKLAPPWLRKRNDRGCMGNNSIIGTCNVGMGSVTNELKNPYCSEDVTSRIQNSGNTFYQKPQHQDQH